ncbi:MAG TPA: hypothetical protein VGN16_06865 [Acidobacteriaceae bacterium]|jgi:hypothetical protein
MARVAANQDRAEADRAHYVYVQHARVTSRKGSKIMCEETTDSRVTPSDKGSEQKIVKLDGRLLVKGRYVTYTALPRKRAKATQAAGQTETKPEEKDVDIEIGDDSTDRDLVENMRENLTNRNSKDGIAANLFPLNSKNQAEDTFRLLGRGPMNGRDAYHIEFSPKDKSDFGWKGDAWIDSSEFQPILVRTAMSRKIPFAVRTMLGINLPGLGFTVVYAPQDGKLWFPVSFGTEFKIKVLFFFNRTIVIAAENRDFERTHVTTTVHTAEATPIPESPQ